MDNRSSNPINIARNSIGKKRIFIHVTANPEMVYLNTDMPGDAVNVKIYKAVVDAAAGKPYYQIEFSTNSVHSYTNTVYGAKPTSFQVISGDNMAKVPIRFYNDHIPQNFKVAIYDPGQSGNLTALGPNGAQLYIQYDFIAT
jgi:hypothetical protein